jgi:hypothetical protein
MIHRTVRELFATGQVGHEPESAHTPVLVRDVVQSLVNPQNDAQDVVYMRLESDSTRTSFSTSRA